MLVINKENIDIEQLVQNLQPNPVLSIYSPFQYKHPLITSNNSISNLLNMTKPPLVDLVLVLGDYIIFHSVDPYILRRAEIVLIKDESIDEVQRALNEFRGKIQRNGA